ncbi:hypothetical protein [Legionella yabuuchiae]|uniref:hypothetical protein n=1 Tax=Legionella yabuuchiae TaxID=376727 RepID=UPI0010550F9B|nr:hypothetical protein [Legionella yabuuchiae]
MTRTNVFFLGKLRDKGVGEGKTSILERKKNDRFRETSPPTINLDFFIVPDPYDEESKLVIWDQAGLKKYSSLTVNRGATIFVYCIDSTTELDEEDIKSNLADAKMASPEAKILLVGTKCDLPNPKFTRKDLQLISDKNGYDGAHLTSAKENIGIIGIDGLFEELHALGNPMTLAIKKAGRESLLGEALIKLINVSLNISLAQKKQLGEAALSLVTKLKGSEILNLETVTQEFISNCEKTLPKSLNSSEIPAKQRSVMKAIAGVVLAVDALFEEVHTLDNPMIQAIKKAGRESLLGQALINLNNVSRNISKAQKKQLGEEALSLVTQLQNSDPLNLETVTQEYISNCEKILPKQRSVMKAIAGVVLAVVVTFIAAVIGFGIGFAAGLWSGPGAFVSGVMAGSAAAVAVAGTSAVAGVGAGALAASRGFFNPVKKPSLEDAVHNVADAAAQAKKS